MLIVLEGLPGSGKTTLIKALHNNPELHLIDEVLADEPENADSNFFLQNDYEKYKLIQPNAINIMDRNYSSTLCYNYCHDKIYGSNAYSTVFNAIENGLQSNQLFVPDAYIVLNCKLPTSLKRQNNTNDPAWKNQQFLKEVQAFYDDYFTRQPCRVIIINTDDQTAQETFEHVHREIMQITNAAGETL